MIEDPSKVARAFAALRKKNVPKVCARCGKAFEGVTKSKYCSPGCNSTVYWDAHREELNRKRREKYARQKGEKAEGAVPE